MNARMTIYSDQSMIDEMKIIAKENGVSVSKMVSDFFYKTISQRRRHKQKEPSLMDLAGCLKDVNIPKDVSYKDIMHQHWEEKYG